METFHGDFLEANSVQDGVGCVAVERSVVGVVPNSVVILVAKVVTVMVMATVVVVVVYCFTDYDADLCGSAEVKCLWK